MKKVACSENKIKLLQAEVITALKYFFIVQKADNGSH